MTNLRDLLRDFALEVREVESDEATPWEEKVEDKIEELIVHIEERLIG